MTKLGVAESPSSRPDFGPSSERGHSDKLAAFRKVSCTGCGKGGTQTSYKDSDDRNTFILRRKRCGLLKLKSLCRRHYRVFICFNRAGIELYVLKVVLKA